MRPTNYLPKPALLLSTLTALSLYGTPVYAQRGGSNNDDETTNTEQAEESTSAAPPARTSSRNNEPETTAEAEETTEAPRRTSSSRREEPTSSSRAPPSSSQEEETSTEEQESTSTEESSSEIPTSTEDIQSTITSIADNDGPTGMPTLTRYKPIPTYPGPTVPPTNDAPFMQHSTAPQGTVFIAVGAILGAFGLAILLWRAIVGFLLHRSVERAARIQHHENAKAGFPAPPAPFYKYTDNGSTLSLSAPPGRGVGVRRTNRGLTPSSNPSQSNLFFSPTAAASGTTPGNRGSSFLPSGFYAAGTSSPGGHEHSISLTNLRPESRGQFGNPSRHTLNPTPPDSPSFRGRRDISSSTLNLNRPPSQRAPSAFLDDLLADDPSSLPPPQMPPSRHSGFNSSPSPLNRF